MKINEDWSMKMTDLYKYILLFVVIFIICAYVPLDYRGPLFLLAFLGVIVWRIIEKSRIRNSFEKIRKEKYEKSEIIKVKKDKALPIYIYSIEICLTFLIGSILVGVLIYSWFLCEDGKITVFDTVLIDSLTTIATLLYVIRFRFYNVLKLYADKRDVINYEKHKVTETETGEKVYSKIEEITTTQNVKIMAERKNYPSKYRMSSVVDSIVSSINYNENMKKIALSDDLYMWNLFKKNIIPSKYSNLIGFLSVDEDETTVKNIDKLCSDFFAKTRERYELRIGGGTIILQLKNARLGRIYRIFNKKKTISQIDETINEISSFLLELKRIISEE